MTYPIDLVYLWVDGSDPDWCARKNHYLQLADAAEHELAVPERWQDNDELKYSLRSVDMFVPWINHIFIVTDNQCPAWINRSHPKITIVDHKEIIPKDKLPVFCSEVIESYIAYIPGLSEHFLFANDDMFFGRSLSPERFFNWDGEPIVQVKQMYPEDFCEDQELQAKLLADSKSASRFRANLMVHKMFHVKMNWQAAHVIDPYRKSFMLEALAEPAFAKEWENSRSHRFRSPDAVQRILFSLYDACRKRTKLVDIKHFKEIKRIFCPWCLPYNLSKESDLRKVLKIRPEMFCYYPELFCNYDGDYRQVLHEFFESYFPSKSSFEK